MVQNTAISAHNNEQMFGLSVEQCEAACCARAWCKSFDYTMMLFLLIRVYIASKPPPTQ